MNLSDALFCVVDTETTGFDPETDHIVEIAAVMTTATRVVGMWAEMVGLPDGVTIPPDVSAVHGIVATDLVGCRPWPAVRESYVEFLRNGRGFAIETAHNHAFDNGFISRGHASMGPDEALCTRRLAQHLWTDAPNYKNQTLRYWRELKVETFGIAPHRALGDALVTASLVRDILGCPELRERGITTVEELLALAASPIRYTKWPLGKYRDKPLDTDLSYVRWALGTGGMKDLDADLRWSLNEVLLASAGRRTG